jgi:hypothetical protein
MVMPCEFLGLTIPDRDVQDRNAATILLSSMIGREIDREDRMEDTNESFVVGPARATEEVSCHAQCCIQT